MNLDALRGKRAARRRDPTNRQERQESCQESCQESVCQGQRVWYVHAKHARIYREGGGATSLDLQADTLNESGPCT